MIPAFFIMTYISLRVDESIDFDLTDVWDEIDDDDFVKEMAKRGLRQTDVEKPTDPKDQIKKIICDANGLNYHTDDQTILMQLMKYFN